jgi:hypothetical protein
MTERVRWTDARLDDQFETVRNELRALRDVPKGMGEIAVELRYIKDDTRELRNDFSAYIEEQTQLRETHRVERKSDLRWVLGTVLTAASLIIAAMAILIGHV